MIITDILEKSPEVIYLGKIADKHLYYHEQSNRDIYLGEMEYLFLESLTGCKTVKEIILKFSISSQKAEMLCDCLCEMGLIKGFEHRKESVPHNITFFSVMSKHRRDYSLNNKKITNIVFGLSFLTPIFLLFWFLDFFSYSTFMFRFKHIQIFDILVFSLIIFVSFFVHEVGHSRYSRISGAYVIRYDFGLITLLPCVTTVISGLSKVKIIDRIKISLAGISNNLLLSTLGAVLIFIRYSFYLEFLVIFNVTLVAFNLIIFLKTDGWQLINILSNTDASTSTNSDYNSLSRILLFLKILIAIVMASFLH